MSITVHPRDFKDSLHTEIQNLLVAISDFVFTMPNGLVFKMSDINKKVPIYLDLKESRVEKHEMTWQELNDKIGELENELSYLENKSPRSKEESNRHECLSGLVNRLKDIRNEHQNKTPHASPSDMVCISEETELNGYYTRKGKNHNPEIVLLMETLGNDGTWSADSVACTLIHEMFHAFYDHDLRKKDNHIPFVEEPLTEYAMLKFIEALARKDNKYERLFDKAKREVREKQFSCGIAHYGFGFYLWKYENELGEPLKHICWIDEFRDAKYKISTMTQEYLEYSKPFHSGIYPFNDEEHQMELLRTVLLNSNGARLPLPVKEDLHPDLTWNRCDTNAYWAFAKDTLYLDGVFLKALINPFIHQEFSEIEDNCDDINQIVLWDHFICDDFEHVHELISTKHVQVKLSSRNVYYKIIDGGIYDASGTMLFYCPNHVKEYVIPDGVKRIIESAFYCCSSLRHVKIPASVHNIPDSTFRGCRSLEDEIVEHKTTLQFPLRGKNLKESEKQYISLISVPKTATSYDIPDGVKAISRDAFSCCEVLRHVNIPESVKKITDAAFFDCESLENEIVLGQRLYNVPASATSYTIPHGASEIMHYAFRHCKALTHLDIPSGTLKEIIEHAFEDCDNLETVTIGEGLEKIEGMVFAFCNISHLTLPASLKVLSASAFYYCPMQTLTFKGANPPKTNKPFDTLNLPSTCTIYVPRGSKTNYENIFPNNTIVEY